MHPSQNHAPDASLCEHETASKGNHVDRNDFTVVIIAIPGRLRFDTELEMETTVMKHRAFRYLRTAALLAAIVALTAPARAAETDIAAAPLGTAPSVSVLPNLMFVLDDSGSMAREFMPDEVDNSNTCKQCTTSGTDRCRVADTSCSPGHPPFFASPFNTIYYNPQITYTPGVDDLGVSLGNANPSAARNNPYDSSSTSTRDLVNTWTELYFCNESDPTSSERQDPAKCRRNGIDTPNPFVYKECTVGTGAGCNGSDMTGGLPTLTYPFAVSRNEGSPYYYEITPREHCTDETLTNCALQAAPDATRPVPAPVRWCRNQTGANSVASTTQVSGGNPVYCQAKWSSTYQYPRLGNIKRTDIVPATATYGGRPNRTDCAAAPTCAYAEELQNFANWYSYYRERMLTMKTAAGRAFSIMDDRYRIGFLTINASGSSKYLQIDKFTSTHKKNWYDKFYAQNSSGSTPLREALSRVGRHYAGITIGINSFMPDDPMQYSCQQNFTILTTDGYWNNNAGVDLNGNTIGNEDNVNSGYSTRAIGAYDGNLGGTAGSSAGSSSTLADVAMYYYKTDLRTSGSVALDNVPTNAKDTAPHQHMVTFTLGMGLDGLMNYRPDYDTATTGDFAKIKAGDPSGCSWTTGQCNWPQAQQDSPSALDDLWHAAVNGRGRYFSAKDPTSLQSGLANALSSIQSQTGAAASSATSTPNITPTDNFIFSSTYRTLKWDGEVVAEKIDTATGNVIPGTAWTAGSQLNARVTAISDTRKILTFDPSGANKLKDFHYANLTATEKAFFDDKCAALMQCPPMTAVQQALVNDGNNLVNWLRGQSGNDALYRARENVLGDTVNSKPAFVGKPILQYADAVSPDYNSFKTANASRQGVLYIAANDGMLHAFNGDTGQELWAYVPRVIMPEMHKLAVSNYDINHRYFVDGSPVVMDVFLKNANAWKTVLVGSFKAGGRGYFALDITDPLNPKGLWEVCTDATLCAQQDDNIGFTFGDPIITKWAKDPDKWVAIVSSGYNNVSPGDGKGYVYVLDIETGKILDKKDTNVGDTTTPSGLAHLTGFAQNFAVDNTATFVYGGDLLGNIWRLDMANMNLQRLGQLFDSNSPGKPQSVTTRVDVTEFDAGFRAIYVGTGLLLGTSDLQDPATLSPPANRAYQQTVYGFKDTGSDLGNLRSPAAKLVEQTISVVDANTRTISNNPVDWSTQNGWYVDLNPANQSPGERVNVDPRLVRGVLLVATNEPNAQPCSAGGDSFLYQFDYRSGSYVASAPAQVVGTKLGSALVAGIVVYRLPSGQLKYSAIDVTGKKTVGGVHAGAGGAIGKRVSWRELIL
jgi:type IV pilus assembly protein PilY1